MRFSRSRVVGLFSVLAFVALAMTVKAQRGPDAPANPDYAIYGTTCQNVNAKPCTSCIGTMEADPNCPSGRRCIVVKCNGAGNIAFATCVYTTNSSAVCTTSGAGGTPITGCGSCFAGTCGCSSIYIPPPPQPPVPGTEGCYIDAAHCTGIGPGGVCNPTSPIASPLWTPC